MARKPADSVSGGCPVKKAAKPTKPKTLRRTQKNNNDPSQIREQLALIYGALEELAERQDLMAVWQSEWAHQLVSLFSTQLNHMESIVGKPIMPENGKDLLPALDDFAGDFRETVSNLGEKYAKRKARGLKHLKKNALAPEESLSLEERESPPILVVPEKSDFH